MKCILCGRDSSVFWYPVNLWGNKGDVCDSCGAALLQQMREAEE